MPDDQLSDATPPVVPEQRFTAVLDTNLAAGPSWFVVDHQNLFMGVPQRNWVGDEAKTKEEVRKKNATIPLLAKPFESHAYTREQHPDWYQPETLVQHCQKIEGRKFEKHLDALIGDAPPEVPDTVCPNCQHDCYGTKPNRHCLECGWKEIPPEEGQKLEAAISEMKAQAEEREHGPKNQVLCPDCMAILKVHPRQDGGFDIEFVKHQT